MTGRQFAQLCDRIDTKIIQLIKKHSPTARRRPITPVQGAEPTTNSQQIVKDLVDGQPGGLEKYPKVICRRCGAEHEFSATEIQMMLQTEAQLRAENEKLKAFADHLDDEREGYVSRLHEFACENERLMEQNKEISRLRKELRAINRGAERNAWINNSLIDQLNAEKKKRKEAEKEVRQIADTIDEHFGYTPDDTVSVASRLNAQVRGLLIALANEKGKVRELEDRIGNALL